METPSGAVPPQNPTEEVVPFNGWVLAWYGLGVLIAATILAAVDRQILVLLAEPIRLSLGLSDTKLGLLQGLGIALFAGIAAFPLGWLADKFSRRIVLASCVLVWTAGTAACGMAWDFSSLFAAAVCLGIGEAGLAPIVYGLIPDMVPARKRVLANGIYAIASIFGAGLGIGLSGELIQSMPTIRTLLPVNIHDLEPWRLAFFVVAVPGPVVALLILTIRTKSSARKRTGDGSPATALLSAYMRLHWKTLLSVIGGTGMGGLGIAALAAWAPVVASRMFGASPQAVGQGISAGYIVGTIVGAVVGGYGVKRLRAHLGVATPLRVMVVGLALSACASIGLAFATTAHQVYWLFGLQVAFLISATVVAPTILQDLTPAALRSRVIALSSVITILLSALSPVLVGLASDLLKIRPDGLQIAVAVVAFTSMLIGAFVTWRAEGRFVQTVRLIGEQPVESAPASLPEPASAPA